MKWAVVIGLASTLAAPGQSGAELQSCLDQVAGAADAFARQAPSVIGQEAMRQTAMVPARLAKGFRVRGTEEPPVRKESHELLSEFGFVSLAGENGRLHEVRQVLEVDGKPLTNPAKARKTLIAGLTSLDDQRKRQMLEGLTHFGLAEVAVDYGQSLLLFQKPQVQDFQFKLVGQQLIGTDEAAVIDFEQRQGESRATLFEAGKTQKLPLRGRLWARKSDCRPLRLRLTAARPQGSQLIADEGTVDYAPSAFNTLLPRTVTHRKLVDGKMVTETVSEFANYQKFSAESQIEFQPPQ